MVLKNVKKGTAVLLSVAVLSLGITGCGGGGGGTGDLTTAIGDSTTNTDVNTGTTSESPITIGSSKGQYKVEGTPGNLVSIVAKSDGAKSRVTIYATDQYLVGHCILGQLTSTAHSCEGNINEDGYIYFTVSDADANTQIDVYELKDNMHLPDAPLDVTNQLPYTAQTNQYVIYNEVDMSYEFIDGDALYIHSLVPGKHYKLRLESPDIRAELKLSNEKVIYDYMSFDDECTVIDESRGISECEYAANENGEIFMSVEPVFGSSIALYTLSLIEIPDDYTGYYEGTPEARKTLAYGNDIPYQTGWEGTFTEGYYRITGLTPSERYTVNLVDINNSLSQAGFRGYDYLLVNGEDTRVGTADENGTLSIDLSLDGTFTIVVEPAPINEGSETAPIEITSNSFAVQAADGYSWYQITGLIADAEYEFAVTDKTNYNLTVHIGYTPLYSDPYRGNIYTDENFHTFIANSEGKIVIRVMGVNIANGEGGRATVEWREIPIP